jgi:hypothetical protein
MAEERDQQRTLAGERGELHRPAFQVPDGKTGREAFHTVHYRRLD